MTMIEKNLIILILAAGQGSRMKSTRAKVLHEIAGLPMISHVVKSAQSLDPSHIIPVLAPDMGDVVTEISPLTHAVQENPLGTGDAVKAGLKEHTDIKGHVLVLYGDVPLVRTRTLSKLIEEHENNKYSISVLGMSPDDPTGYGRLIQNADGTLESIVEHKDASEKERCVTLCNSGIMVIDGTYIHEWLSRLDNNNTQDEFYLVDLVKIAKEEGHRCGIVMGDVSELHGVNDRVQLAQLENIWQKRKRLEIMQSGVTLQDPDTIYFSYDTQIGQESIIGANTVFGVGVEIADNVTIKPFCHIEHTIIHTGGVIGPFARLRPGTTLEKNVKIGNFVEVKNAHFGAGAKANHLTYIGDATLGEATNIGAGTITCNYDGKDKHKTNIGAGVFVGSNSTLIAPITLEDGCYVGAGSTLSKDVPAHALAVARTRPILKENWAKKKAKKGT